MWTLYILKKIQTLNYGLTQLIKSYAIVLMNKTYIIIKRHAAQTA
jgi:hypothetical protein